VAPTRDDGEIIMSREFPHLAASSRKKRIFGSAETLTGMGRERNGGFRETIS